MDLSILLIILGIVALVVGYGPLGIILIVVGLVLLLVPATRGGVVYRRR